MLHNVYKAQGPATGFLNGPHHENKFLAVSYSDLSEAMSIAKRYFTSDLSIRS